MFRSTSKILACVFVLAASLSAQQIQVPGSLPAGEDAAFSTTGSGKATFYLSGPGVARKAQIDLGSAVHVRGTELQNAGAYLAVVCADSCQTTQFYVVAADPARLAFIVHPSRVPVAHSDAISGVALPFDKFENLILKPLAVDFHLTTGNTSLLSRSVQSENGVAWFRTASGKTAGKLQVEAALPSVTAVRAVQEVASDPCNLRITGQRTTKGVLVETDPVRDCSGNILPDGTIVTFTLSGENGKSTVDAPIKQGIAKADIPANGPQTVSVASGVVMGNDLHIGGR